MRRLLSGAIHAGLDRSSGRVKARYARLRRGSDVRVLRGAPPGEYTIAARPPSSHRAGPRCTVTLREATSDWSTFEDIFVHECYNLDHLARGPSIHDLFGRIRTAGSAPLILDIGANIGLAALYFSLRYPGARVITVEPAATNLEVLDRNCGGTPKIVSYAAGIACRAGSLSVVNPSGEADAFQTRCAPAGEGEVAAITVNDLLRAHGRSDGCVPFIAKIDVEGFESDLFSENYEWIEDFPVLIVELHDWMMPGRAPSRNFLRAISQCDRDFVHIGENVFSLSNTLLAVDGATVG